MNKERLAKQIRILSAPPVMAAAMIVTLLLVKNEIFGSQWNAIMMLIHLSAVPALAYPLAAFLYGKEKNRREKERRLAFIMNLAGYATALIYVLATDMPQGSRLIAVSYFLSVVVLSFFNKVLHIRASGHASCVAAPMLITSFFLGWQAGIICIGIFAAVAWSSVLLKRHTPKELTLGAICSVLSFEIAWMIVF